MDPDLSTTGAVEIGVKRLMEDRLITEWNYSSKWNRARNPSALLICICTLLFMYVLCSIVFYRVRFRWWLIKWYFSRDKVRAWLPKDLWWFYRSLQLLQGIVYVCFASLPVLAILSLYFASSRNLYNGNIRNLLLSTVFFLLYLLCLSTLFLFWRSNQWSLLPQIRVITASDVPLRVVREQQEVWTDQSSKEWWLCLVFWMLLGLALFSISSANLSLTPFGECQIPKSFTYVPCNTTKWWYVLNTNGYYEVDVAWVISLNWTILTINLIFVFAAAYFDDYYQHAGADLLVEVQARVAENVIRYGLTTSSDQTFESVCETKMPRLRPVAAFDQDEASGGSQPLTTTGDGLSVALTSSEEKRVQENRQGDNGVQNDKDVFHLGQHNGGVYEDDNEIEPRFEYHGDLEDIKLIGLDDDDEGEKDDMENNDTCNPMADLHSTLQPILVDSKINPFRQPTLNPSLPIHSSIPELQEPISDASPALSGTRPDPGVPTSTGEATPTKMPALLSNRDITREIHRASMVFDGWQKIADDALVTVHFGKKPNANRLEPEPEEEKPDLDYNGRNKENGQSKGDNETNETASHATEASSSNGFVAISQAYIQTLIENYMIRMKHSGVICYLVSVLFLFMFGVFKFLASGRSLAFFQVVGCFMADSVLLIKFSASTYRKGQLRAGTGFVRVSNTPVWFLCVILLISRFIVALMPSNSWFLGQGILYVVFGGFISYLLINDYVGAEWYSSGNGRTQRALFYKLWIDTGLWRSSVSDFWCFLFTGIKVFCREISFLVFTIYFGVVSWVLTVDRSSGKPLLGMQENDMHQISIIFGKTKIPQWMFGALSMLLLFDFIVTYSLVLLWNRLLRKRELEFLGVSQHDIPSELERNRHCLGEPIDTQTTLSRGENSSVTSTNVDNRNESGQSKTERRKTRKQNGEMEEETNVTLTGTSMVRALFCSSHLFALTIGSMLIIITLSIATAYFISSIIFKANEHFVIICTIGTLLPVLLVGQFLHQVWVADDFVFWMHVPPKPPDSVVRDAADGNLPPRISMHLKQLQVQRHALQQRNMCMLVGTVLIVVFFIIWGASLNQNVPSFSFEFAIAYPCSVLSFICGLLGAQMWFHTLTFSATLKLLYCSHIGLITISFVVGFEKVFDHSSDDSYHSMLETILMVLLILPAFLLSSVAMLVYRDDHFRMSFFVAFSFMFGCLIALGMGLWATQRFGIFGSVFYYLAVVISMVAACMWVWWNASKIEEMRGTKLTLIVVSVSLVLLIAFVVLGAFDISEGGTKTFYGLVFLFISFVVFLIFAVASVFVRVRHLVRNSTKLSPSPTLLGIPVVAYKVENRGGELILRNSFTLHIVGICLVLQLFGYVVAIWLNASVGTTISSLALCILVIYSLQMTLQRNIEFRHSVVLLNDFGGLENVFEQVLHESVQRCIDISQQAMMATWLNERNALSKKTSKRTNKFAKHLSSASNSTNGGNMELGTISNGMTQPMQQPLPLYQREPNDDDDGVKSLATMDDEALDEGFDVGVWYNSFTSSDAVVFQNRGRSNHRLSARKLSAPLESSSSLADGCSATGDSTPGGLVSLKSSLRLPKSGSSHVLEYNNRHIYQSSHKTDDAEADQVDEDGQLEEEDRFVEIQTPKALSDYYQAIYRDDVEYQMYLRDSCKYDALFHVLLWMRTTQLFLRHGVNPKKGMVGNRLRVFETAASDAAIHKPESGIQDSVYSVQNGSFYSSLAFGTQSQDIAVEISVPEPQQAVPSPSNSDLGFPADQGHFRDGPKPSIFMSSTAALAEAKANTVSEKEKSSNKKNGEKEKKTTMIAASADKRNADMGFMRRTLNRKQRLFHKLRVLQRGDDSLKKTLVDANAAEPEQTRLGMRTLRSRSVVRTSQHRMNSHLSSHIADKWVNLTDEEAAERVKGIIGQFETTGGEPWYDNDFPPTNRSLFLDWDDADFVDDVEDLADLHGALWCRSSDICPDAVSRLTGHSTCVTERVDGRSVYDPTEVMQGGVGDCWLLSAVSVVALNPRLINRVLVTQDRSRECAYHVRLFLDGKWENILVDDQFPCSLEQSLVFDPQRPHCPMSICDRPPDMVSPVYSPEAAYHPKRKWRLPLPLYCRNRSGTAMWAMLIEKAYAKRFGSYESLNGGHVHTALVDLTGGFSQLFSLRDDVELVVSGALWDKLVDFHRRGALLAAGSPATNEAGEEVTENGALSTTPNGIVHGHAYSIVRVEDQMDYHGHHRLLKLRDPWGVARWRGKWSKYDKKSWTRRMQRRLDYQVNKGATSITGWREIERVLEGMSEESTSLGEYFRETHQQEMAAKPGGTANTEDEQGTFWISLEDFIDSFKWLYVCQLFDPAQWVQKSIMGEWTGVSAGGPPNQPHAKNNPQFSFCIKNVPKRTRGMLIRQRKKTVRLFVSISNLQESQHRFDPGNLCSSLDDGNYGNHNFNATEAEYQQAANASGRRYPFMSLLLLDIGGGLLSGELLAKNVVASTGKYKDSRDLSFETKIPNNSDVTFTIFPSLYPKGEEGFFRINIYCEADFSVHKIL